MTANAVIDGSFADLRLVKTRSVAQIIVEIPIERAEELVQKFGIPLPGQEIAVAIARLSSQPAEPKQPDPSRSDRAKAQYRNQPPMKQAAERAAMLCADAKFHLWIMRKHGVVFPDGAAPANIAANWMRRYLGVDSRSEIGLDKEVCERFLALETAYKQGTGQMAEIRG